MKSRKKISAGLAVFVLMIAGAAGFAQRHFMLAHAARPEVNVQLAGAVERDAKLMVLDKSTVVNPGEVLDWTINAENAGNAPALEYKTVGHIPRGTEFVAGRGQQHHHGRDGGGQDLLLCVLLFKFGLLGLGDARGRQQVYLLLL